MARKTKSLIIGIASILLALPAVAQTFEVVSIKPNTSGASEPLRLDPSGRLVATNTTTRMLLRVAFDDKSVYGALPDFRLVGGPDWLATDRFDIQAQPDRPIRPEDIGSAVLAILEDRFRLKAHHEQRQLPVYELTLANGQSKMKAVDAPTPGVEETGALRRSLAVMAFYRQTLSLPQVTSSSTLVQSSARPYLLPNSSTFSPRVWIARS